MKQVPFFLATVFALCPANGWAQSAADEAFARRDFAAAQQLWQLDAQNGDADAMLGLGLLLDRGYGGVRDPDAAFDWYLQAAELGLAEAQFNIAVMYDAGLGRIQDSEAALMWYTRAAIRGHARAQYNLGLIYDSADVSTANPQLAQYWFDASAATLPAGADKVRQVATSDLPNATAEILFASSGDTTELVWTTTGQASAFYIESLESSDTALGYESSEISDPITGSGIIASDDRLSNAAFLRILTFSPDQESYTASDWTDMGPRGRVTLVADPAVPGMMDAAAIFAQDLQAAGYWTNVTTLKGATSDSFINYAFDQDNDVAQVIASYLPKPVHDVTLAREDTTLRPGEIEVDLSALRPVP